MKTYIKITFLTAALSIKACLISCEKLLEVDTPSNQITSDQVFENLQTANAALAGLYSGLWDNSPIAGDQSGMLMSMYTDELSYYASASTNGLAELYQNTVIDTNPALYTYWTNAYQKVYMANAIIEGIEKSTSIPIAEKQRIRGEALMIRSLLFYYLQQLYGDIPYPVTTNYMINQSISKTPALEVLQRLTSDLNEVIPLLQDQYRHTERIYPNRKTAQLILAKIYMLQKNWNAAEGLLKEIIHSPLYQFQNDITKVFDKSGSHIIWQLKPRNGGDATKEIAVFYFTNSAPTSVALSPHLINSFSGSDKRKQFWTSAVTVGNNTWYRPNKYKNLSNNNTEYSVVFRLEEAYLLLAETLAEQNKINESLQFINAVKQRAGIPLLTGSSSKEMILSEISVENCKEFFTEMGHRFLDLKRQGKLSELSTVKPNWKLHFVVLPIPQKELLLNPNIQPQNSGY
ncbi:RagB/SusD family nutrient uptake outer membrane protein [Pedobacter alluvionis]|uniref:RagB/SusD family nutrient uptake outer membrane protein n=1 Tax=Pedobacter alluvionis TaxID=475253 RepID=A0A497XYU0_9SPHI|nr:RagB/SusD family nutrient uptake outer membrane protein [Pedobacter alluvionis]RLJ75123.1 SusD-like starch-binding protein associating with outer membrane [Pedobacter alluvionis]TFB30227.1 RagB/SusD family nutrient uptake outer membrane protein [Pedobacter alluvionis]